MTPPPTIVKTAETHHQKTSTPNGKIRGQQTVASTKYQDSVIEPSSPPDPSTKSSQCSSLSDGESYECFGENDQMTSTIDTDNLAANADKDGVDLDLAPHFQSSDIEKNSISRNSWARTSLRGLRGSMKRPLGSNVLANHLYRSSSFNSSGRSSNCDTTEDMYSDVSLEDVQDLNHKLELLQRQITSLTDTHMNTEDRNIRAKTDYAVLQTKYQMLEDQLRETEMRCEERILEEQKRCRELLTRVERESELKNENCQIRIQTTETEVSSLRDEIHRLRTQCDKQAMELSTSEEKLENSRYNLTIAQENLMEARALEKRHLTEKNQSDQMIMELHKEIERIRSEAQAVMNSVRRSNGFNTQNSASSLSLESNVSSNEPFRMDEILNELEDLKLHNRQLSETNEELQAMLLSKNIEEGRNLLNGGTSNLADELKEMNQSQDESLMNSLSQLQSAYQERDEECKRLKRYIDNILLNIVENHPQLLEIKTSTMEQ